jgi:hypothetical protein
MQLRHTELPETYDELLEMAGSEQLTALTHPAPVHETVPLQRGEIDITDTTTSLVQDGLVGFATHGR